MSQEDEEFFYRDSIIIDAVPLPPEEGDDINAGNDLNELNQLNDELSKMEGGGERRDPQLTAREVELIDELNKLRTNPNEYAQLLIRRRKHFYRQTELEEGQNQSNTNIKEGKQAVLECIESLEKTSPAPALQFPDGMHLASQDIREMIGEQNGTEPTSAEEVNEALYRYGSYTGRAVQLIGFGYNNPKEVISHLLISDGEGERRSRKILLDPEFQFCGLAMGDHGMVVFHFISDSWTEN